MSTEPSQFTVYYSPRFDTAAPVAMPRISRETDPAKIEDWVEPVVGDL